MLVFGRQGQQGPWGSLAILTELMSPRPMKAPCLKKQYGWFLKNTTCSWPLASTCTHKSFTHSRLHTHTHIHPRVLRHLFFFTKGFSVLPIVASASCIRWFQKSLPWHLMCHYAWLSRIKTKSLKSHKQLNWCHWFSEIEGEVCACWVGGILATCLAPRLLLPLRRTWIVFLCQSASATGQTNPT